MLAFLLQFNWFQWVFQYRKVLFLAGFIVFFVGAVFYIRHVVVENAKLERQVEDLQAVLETERDTHRKVVEALEGRARDAEERSNFQDKSRKEIEKDKKQGDGPVAPVLRNTVERLRAREAEFRGNP